MSPTIALLIVIVVIAIVSIILTMITRVRKIKNIREHQMELKTGKRICIHTHEDCQSCMAANGCVQRYGKGLLGHRLNEE